MIRYFPTAGDRHGWAIDEDRRLIRRALQGTARESSLWRADVVHAPFWMALTMHHPLVLRRRFVVAHADNPPFFYLTQPEFAAGQRMVDLWVARSREAIEQFQALRLPAVHVPYAIDDSMFFPIADRAALRARYGIPPDAYVIGNFHRDSEGADLSQPKLQKAPETLLAILRLVREAGRQPHILLAGPRRHWIRQALARDEIPFTFVGQAGLGGDDFGTNILSRPQLNELYNACDLYLVPSRWEGGPQSAMEAAAARVKILSFPLGVARDILERASLFDTPAQAAAKIIADMREGSLESTLDAQRERLLFHHTADAMARGVRRIYDEIPERVASKNKGRKSKAGLRDLVQELGWQVKRRHATTRQRAARFSHVEGKDPFLDEAVANLEDILTSSGRSFKNRPDNAVVAAHSAEASQFRLLTAGGCDHQPADQACRVALSVQDAINFKASGHQAPVLVCPLVFNAGAEVSRHLTVSVGDESSSLAVMRCMLAGGVPVYPSGTPYYYQIFHGGVPYGAERTLEEATCLAERDEDTLSTLSRLPSPETAARFWRKLLSS